MTDNNGFHQLKPGVITHAKRDTLDLVISSSLLLKHITESYVKLWFHVISDYEIILSRLELERPSSINISHPSFQLKKIDEKQFVIN